MKKILITMCVLGLVGSQVHAKDEPITQLEIKDANLPGGTYDNKIELQKKVDEVNSLKMTLDQNNTIKDVLLMQHRMAQTPYTHTAKPTTRSLNIDFTPGVTPPIIRLSANMLTTLVFTDKAGNPWNIASVALNREIFSDGVNLQQNRSNGSSSKLSNILTLEPLNPVAYGNMAVTLEGFDTPVIVMLATGQSDVDVRVDIRLSAINPNRAIKSKFNSFKSLDMDDLTLKFVDGVPPKDAMPLKTSSGEIEAWELDEQMIIRTRNTVIYPAYDSSATSSSGVTVYKMNPDVRAITISTGNSTKTIFIEKN